MDKDKLAPGEKHAYSIHEFCLLNGIGRATFYELVKRREAPAIMKVGNRVLISQEAAATWRRETEVRSAAPTVAQGAA